MVGWCCSDSGKRSSDLDQELGQKVVSGQDSWLILKVDPTEISSGSNVDMSKGEIKVDNKLLTLNNWKNGVFINWVKEDCGRGSYLWYVCCLKIRKVVLEMLN